MSANTAHSSSRSRSYKLRGTVVSVDLVTHTIMILPSAHDGTRVRLLTVTPHSEIHCGEEPKTLADVIVGDWVQVHFLHEKERVILKKLSMPRGMVKNSPHQAS